MRFFESFSGSLDNCSWRSYLNTIKSGSLGSQCNKMMAFGQYCVFTWCVMDTCQCVRLEDLWLDEFSVQIQQVLLRHHTAGVHQVIPLAFVPLRDPIFKTVGSWNQDACYCYCNNLFKVEKCVYMCTWGSPNRLSHISLLNPRVEELIIWEKIHYNKIHHKSIRQNVHYLCSMWVTYLSKCSWMELSSTFVMTFLKMCTEK